MTTLSSVLGAEILLHIALNSNDIYTSLRIKRNKVEKATVLMSTSSATNSGVSKLQKIQIPRKLNLANPDTMYGIPLFYPLHLTMLNIIFAIDIQGTQSY